MASKLSREVTMNGADLRRGVLSRDLVEEVRVMVESGDAVGLGQAPEIAVRRTWVTALMSRLIAAPRRLRFTNLLK